MDWKACGGKCLILLPLNFMASKECISEKTESGIVSILLKYKGEQELN